MPYFRSCHRTYSLKRGVLENFAILTGKRLFSHEFCKIFKNLYWKTSANGCLCMFSLDLFFESSIYNTVNQIHHIYKLSKVRESLFKLICVYSYILHHIARLLYDAYFLIFFISIEKFRRNKSIVLMTLLAFPLIWTGKDSEPFTDVL